MLAEGKDLSELMVDLAYAALYFGDAAMAEEVSALEERMDDLVHDMRSVCVMAGRNPREADALASEPELPVPDSRADMWLISVST